MKNRGKLLIVFVSIGILLTSCSSNSKISKDSNITVEKTAIASPKVNAPVDKKVVTEDAEITLSFNNVKFNLNKHFDDIALNNLDLKSLSILRNSLYAKYGYIFSSKEFSDYFAQLSWYVPTNKSVEEKLNSIDTENIKNILVLEAKKGTVSNNSNDNYADGEKYGYLEKAYEENNKKIIEVSIIKHFNDGIPDVIDKSSSKYEIDDNIKITTFKDVNMDTHEISFNDLENINLAYSIHVCKIVISNSKVTEVEKIYQP